MTVDLAADKLKSFIFDDDKLVTYKWLSKNFGIHVNVSKQMLWEFWKNYKKEDQMVATFLIMGQLIDGSERIEVVQESNLANVKEKFSKIDCEHIYSLQRSLSSLQTLVLEDQVDTRFISIKCKESVLKPEQNLIPQPKKNREEEINPVEKNHSLEKDTEKKHDLKSLEEEVSPVRELSPKKHKKGRVEKVAVSKEKKNKVSDKLSKKPVQSLKTAFEKHFGKVSNSNLKSLSAETEKIERKEDLKENCVSSVESDVQVDEKIEVSEESNNACKLNDKRKLEKNASHQNNSKKRNKRKILDVKTNETVNKRRRIISDSDSSEEDSVVNESEEIESSENIDELKKPKSYPEIKRNDNKCIIRKTEDVRFLNQDGFLVTKKITVSQEAEVDVKTELSPPTPRLETNVNKKQTKQSSLLNFFKKT